jgi:hypothetical protein
VADSGRNTHRMVKGELDSIFGFFSQVSHDALGMARVHNESGGRCGKNYEEKVVSKFIHTSIVKLASMLQSKGGAYIKIPSLGKASRVTPGMLVR